MFKGKAEADKVANKTKQETMETNIYHQHVPIPRIR